MTILRVRFIHMNIVNVLACKCIFPGLLLLSELLILIYLNRDFFSFFIEDHIPDDHHSGVERDPSLDSMSSRFTNESSGNQLCGMLLFSVNSNI